MTVMARNVFTGNVAKFAQLFEWSAPRRHVCHTLAGHLTTNSVRMSSSEFTSCSVRPLLFERITENGFRPTRGSKCAAGYDLYSAYDCVVPKRGKQLVKTDIRVAVPHGCYGRIAPRSGLAWKHSIDVGAGVIDADYRGNVGVILFNHSDIDFTITRGDRIAQLIPEMIADTELIEAKLDSTERQDNGFGSTGEALNPIQNKENN